MTRQTGQKVVGGILTIAGLGLGIWTLIISIDLITFFYFYWTSNSILQDYGVNEYLAKSIAVLLSAFIIWFTNGLLVKILKRDRRWVLAVMIPMIAWFTIMYIISSPYSGRPFNVFDGNPGNYYRDQFSTIHMAPRGQKIGPYGEAIAKFDEVTAKEYERQVGSPFESSLSSRFRGLRNLFDPEPELQMTVESVNLEKCNNRYNHYIETMCTIVNIAVRRKNNSKPGRFYEPSGNYLVDEKGKVYEMIDDRAFYNHLVDSETHEENPTATKFTRVRDIREYETYRFNTSYEMLDKANHIRMYDSRFGPVDLDYQVKKAWIKKNSLLK